MTIIKIEYVSEELPDELCDLSDIEVMEMGCQFGERIDSYCLNKDLQFINPGNNSMDNDHAAWLDLYRCAETRVQKHVYRPLKKELANV